ncbi:MAG TPA: lysophospholipid acyltransferase family protein [Kofleriaceae bacterium]|nr:lysophospholipid acyltransferase family protein [Kofleriaceae bacterium]
MGFGLSLYTCAQVARTTLPTVAEALVGRQRTEIHDRRLAAFARRVIRKTGIKLDLRGRDQVPADGAYVFMSNHQSHMDIPVLYGAIPARTFRMVAKAELFRIPLFGRAMRIGGMVELDRQSRHRAIASLRGAEAALAGGMSLWIAPEGTRSQTGRLGPLKKGGFYLAVATGAPIVPVALSGTREILPPGTTRIVPDRPVRVVFGAPIATAGRQVADLSAEVAEFLATHVVPGHTLP